jgi:hypothetical protein
MIIRKEAYPTDVHSQDPDTSDEFAKFFDRIVP